MEKTYMTADQNREQSYKRAKLQDNWDAIVIGSGIGGLTPAAILARKGWRVLVLERHATAGGCTHAFKREGYEWDVGLHYMGEVHRKDGGLRRIFDFISDGKLDWAPMPDVYNRIVIADRMYEYVSGAERFKARMKEYFPDETTAIDRYVTLVMAANKAAKGFFGERAMPPGASDGIYARVGPAFHQFSQRTVLEVLNDLTSNQELIAVLCGHYGDYSLLPSKASFAMHAMLIKHYIDGAGYPVGGASRIAETIGDVIRAAGGEMLVAADVEQVLVRDGKACGVVMQDGRELLAPVVLSDAGITNSRHYQYRDAPLAG
jgi:all-trans-retinol 13,14-reductase